MKKTGFTLAEVLITLGIIGVVAALTMPTFTARTQTAKIGPALAKASTAFAESMKMMMTHFEADSLSGMSFCNNGELSCPDANKILTFNATTTDTTGEMFWSQFANFMSGSEIPPASLPSGVMNPSGSLYGFQSADGTVYYMKDFDQSFSTGSPNKSTYSSEFFVDINGVKEPNKEGRDQFVFYLLDNGTLLPKGSSSTVAKNRDADKTWLDNCPKDAIPGDASFCAGHVFENGLKVEYK